MPGGRHLPDTACFPPATGVTRGTQGADGSARAGNSDAASRRATGPHRGPRPAASPPRPGRWRGWTPGCWPWPRRWSSPPSAPGCWLPGQPGWPSPSRCTPRPGRRFRPGGRVPHRRRLVHPAHRRPPQRPRSRPVLRMLVCRHGHRSDVERRRPPYLPHHANHRSNRRQWQPGRGRIILTGTAAS